RDAPLVHFKSPRRHSRQDPLFVLQTPASKHRFLLLWLPKLELSGALEIFFAALLDFLSHRANPSCLQLRTRRATTASDRRDQFPGAGSANLRPDCVPPSLRYPPRKQKRGNGGYAAEIRDPGRGRGAPLRSNPEYLRS